MSCGGCDDCNSDAFHIHITVESSPVYAVVCNAIKVKPLVIRNFVKHGRDFYEECIATLQMTGVYRDALNEVDHLTTLIERYGLKITRRKIESSPLVTDAVFADAQYFECHYKLFSQTIDSAFDVSRRLYLPLSIRVKNPDLTAVNHPILTLRSFYKETLAAFILRANQAAELLQMPLPPVEVALIDTNPGLDEKWVNQWQEALTG